MSSSSSQQGSRPPPSATKTPYRHGAGAAPRGGATPNRRGAAGGTGRGGGSSSASSVAASQDQFPMLPLSEVVECLHDFGIHDVTVDEIKDPIRHKDRTKEIFMRFLLDCQGVEETDFVMPEAAAALQHATTTDGSQQDDGSRFYLPEELHTRAWSTIAYFKALHKFLTGCGCNDLALRDVVRPDKNRFHRQLCAMIAFVKFQQPLNENFNHLLHPERAQILDEITQLEQIIHESIVRLEELKSEEPFVLEAINECDRDCVEAANEIKSLTQVNSQLRTMSEQLTRTKAKLTDEVEGAELSVQECSTELQKWTSRRVQSPERKKQGVAHKTQLLEVIKTEVKEVEQQWNAAKVAKNRCNDVCQKLEALQLDALIEVATASDQTAQANRQGQAKVLASQQLALQESTNVTKAEREYQRHIDQCKGERTRQELQLAAAQESYDTVLNQLLRLEKDRRDAMARTEQAERDVAAISAKLDDEKRAADETVQSMVRQYRVQERAWKSRLETQMQELGIDVGDENTSS